MMMCFVIFSRDKRTPPPRRGTRLARDIAVGIARKGRNY